MLGVDIETLLQLLSGLIKLHFLEVDHSELAVSLVVLGVFLDTLLVMRDGGVSVVGHHMEGFT